MVILLNKTARVIVLGGRGRLVPATPFAIESMTADEVKRMYPAVAELIETGEIKVVNKEQAEKAKAELDALTLKELQAYAQKKGINVAGMTKKAEVLAAIKAGE